MPLPYPYPYDSLGTAGTNRIVNEVRVITPPTDPELANWIMPAAAPFHSDSVIMRLGPLPTDTALTFGVDYVFTHYFVSLSQHIAKPIYGSIKFLNRNFSGSVYLTYQTVGGPFTVADTLILENLSRSLYNISTVTWDQIQGVPQFFPPAPHQHDVADMTGMADVVTALNSLVTAIAGQNGNIAGIVTTLQQHIASLSAHTPAAVGLGNVPNFAVATLQDVLDAVSNKLMTPERTLQQVTLLTAGLATAAQVAAEATARQNADTALQQAIDNEATARQNADTLATQALATESTSRQNADASLHSEVVTETNARVAGDQHLQDQIDSLSAAAGGFASQTDLNNEITNRQSAVSAEATARANADTTLQNNIDSEATARANADTDLQNQINAITGSSGSFATTAQLTAEATTRYNDDQALQSSITAEANTRGNAIAFEFSERVAADAALQGQITNHVVPTPSTGGLFLQSTGNTPGSYDWLPFNVNNLRAVDAAYLHDGFELVWANNTLRLLPRNGGLIWVNGTLYQIPNTGVRFLPIESGSWLSDTTYHGKSAYVYAKEDGLGGITLWLAGDSIVTPALNANTGFSGPLLLHPVSKTPVLSVAGVTRNDYTLVGCVKFGCHNGLYPGYYSGASGFVWPGKYVWSMNSSYVQEFVYASYNPAYEMYDPNSGTYIPSYFEHDDIANTTRFLLRHELTARPGAYSGELVYGSGIPYSVLFGLASCLGTQMEELIVDFNVSVVGGTANDILWGGLADGNNTPPYEDTSPSYIPTDGSKLPNGIGWCVSGVEQGRGVASFSGQWRFIPNNQPTCVGPQFYLFSSGALPANTIRLSGYSFRTHRKNRIWRDDV